MSSEPGPRVIAEFVDYPGMLDGLRARVSELNVHGERFDEFAGLPQGYLSKLIGARPVKRIGMNSLGPLLDALGLKCVFVESEESTKRLKNRLEPRNPNLVRNAAWEIKITRRFLQKIGRSGGKKRMLKLSKAQRSKLARHANRIRWHGASSPASPTSSRRSKRKVSPAAQRDPEAIQIRSD